ncbi:hypothetical protein WICPIJ_001864 [Wickerhamomyces pijperi]|uniref:Uncharacterized protein n=1 Tax=Wickerhamomyces pijperi TaxID=599730 RepID=A0A9P8QCU6_WICPI|nr:hypothetical protein WICPIJ_001864 [Wickerhamomyces pijperi]
MSLSKMSNSLPPIISTPSLQKILLKLSKLQNLDQILSDNLDLIFTIISYSHIFASELLKLKPHFIKLFKQLVYRVKLISFKYFQTKKPAVISETDIDVATAENEAKFKKNQATYDHFFDLTYSRDLYGIISSISNFKIMLKMFKSVMTSSTTGSTPSTKSSKLIHSLSLLVKVIDLTAFSSAVILEAIGVSIYTTVLPSSLTTKIQSSFEYLFGVKIDDLCDWTFTQAYKIITVRFLVDILLQLKSKSLDFTSGKQLFIELADLIFLHSWGWPDAVDKLAFAGSGFASSLIKLSDVLVKL